MLRVLVIALVLLIAVMFMIPHTAKIQTPVVAKLVEPPRSLPAVDLVDQDGRHFDWQTLHGEFALLYFGFTHCPDVCPLTLRTLSAARAQIAQRAPGATPKVVFVSVDAKRDTPDVLRTYLKGFDNEFIGVTGGDKKLRPLLDSLDVAVHKDTEGHATYTVVHSTSLYFVGPDAEVLALSTGPHEPKTLAGDYFKVRLAYFATHRADQR